MRLNNIFIAFFLILIIILPNALAQTGSIPITRSTEKVLIGGKVFFVHTVKKGETLYSIARAYQMNVADVIANNPNMSTDLQPGQTIRIPDLGAKPTVEQVPASESQITHIVSAGQTVYGISRIYGVSVSDIESINPELKYDSLQINQVIRIPEKKKEQDSSKNKSIVHKVLEKETLYSLSKNYGVSQEEIIKFNYPLLNDGLKTGMEIMIPATNKDSGNISKVQLDSDCNIDALKARFDTVHVSLLLPLFSMGTTDSNENDDETNDENLQVKQTDELNPVAINFIEFYQGFLLAASELKRKGLHIKVSVFDTEKDTKNIESITSKASFKKSDIIVGPVYPDQIKMTLDKSKSQNSVFISPVAQHPEITSKNPRLYQVNPGIDNEFSRCIDMLIADTSKNIIVIYRSEANSNEDAYANFNKILQNRIDDRQIKIKKVNIFNNDFSNLEQELDSLRENIVFSPVNDEIFVTAMFSQLDSKLLLYKIKAIGLGEWLNYSGIDLNYFYELNMSYFSGFYANYQHESTKSILKKYRITYGTEPVRYSKYGFNYGILGYNTAYYFISAYSYFGFDIASHTDCLKKLPVPTPFYFVPTNDEGGFQNQQLKRITFNKDYSLEVED